jgi:hypothetical protein
MRVCYCASASSISSRNSRSNARFARRCAFASFVHRPCFHLASRILPISRARAAIDKLDHRYRSTLGDYHIGEHPIVSPREMIMNIGVQARGSAWRHVPSPEAASALICRSFAPCCCQFFHAIPEWAPQQEQASGRTHPETDQGIACPRTSR